MLWAPPRTLSTAVERCLIENPAIQVYHEPFGTPHYWSSEAASTREARSDEHAATPSFSDVAELLFRTTPPPEKTHVFSKNLAYYFAPHCLRRMSQMLDHDYAGVVHSFIIRHPAKAVTSLYYKSCVDNATTGYTHFDKAEAGYTAMRDILDHVEQQPDAPPCVIIDADDLLEDPEGVMSAYCAAVGLPFRPSMLSWQPGPVKELESPWSGWTDDVINSCGITPKAKSSTLPPLDTLPDEVKATIAEAMPVYERMHARRLRPVGAVKKDAAAPAATHANNNHEVVAEQGAGAHPARDPIRAGPVLTTPPGMMKRKPIGASYSLDEVLFAFKLAHPVAPAPASRTERLVSLSKPIRAVLSADILLSPPTAVPIVG